jgi:hypothetical protein
VQAKYPQAKLIQYEPVNNDTARAASKAAFGDYYDTQYNLADADVILALDADFLGGIGFPGFLPMAAAYAERHRFDKDKPMNRLYVVETMPTVTGYKAEHRLALKPSDIDQFALASEGIFVGSTTINDPAWRKFWEAVVTDLKKANGRAVVIAGPQSSAACHSAAFMINQAIGAVGKTVTYTETVAPLPSEQTADLKSLVADMNAGKVQWLVMLGANPLYSAPADLNFLDAFNKVPNAVHLGTHVDETGFYSTWHIPKAHYLESWTDARSYDGTISIIQPMIDPLYGGKSAHDILQTLLDPRHQRLQRRAGERQDLHHRRTSPRRGARRCTMAGLRTRPSRRKTPWRAEVRAVRRACIQRHRDQLQGRPLALRRSLRQQRWMQELPKQVTSMSWDNAALMSLDLMSKLGIEENEAIELTPQRPHDHHAGTHGSRPSE